LIDPERWRKASPYLERALTLPDGERAAWLAALRERDPALAADVQELVEEHTELARAEFLETTGPAHPGSHAAAGQVIGPYTLVSPLGQGGMGTVWLARRSDGRYERNVAVKFPSIALSTSAGERFKREGSFLGRLVHPHIADLIDAGVAADGQPYLVLEHVDGQPIDRYCAESGLGVEARVRLFLDVLAAVAHAHANLIVHRDLKPSNVLVTGAGEVKLLDFGIAKLLADDAGRGAAEPLTREGGVAMTPEYAAPEQITGGQVTTATDVYALGVLLYVLLTGTHPVGPGPHAPAQLVQAVVETVPPRPSDATGQRALRGDLDTIVAKALKKDPRDRYASVTALANDLRRHLKHEPIDARPDTLAYRAGKFLRRNRLGIALASLATLATVAGIVAILVQSRAVRNERDFATSQWSRAEAINDLGDFLAGESTIPGETLDLAERTLGLRQSGNPSDRVEILVLLSLRSPLEQGNVRARRMAQEAYDLSRAMHDPSPRAKAACALAVSLAVDVALSDKSLLPRAEALVQEGLSELPEQPQFAFDRAFCLLQGSYVSRARGAADESIHRLRNAQELLARAPYHSEAFDLKVSMFLGDSLRLKGRYREAEAEYGELSARLDALGRGETAIAGSTNYKWGQALYALGRPKDAEERIHRAIVQFSHSEDAPDAIPWQLLSHARAERDLGQLARADTEAEHAYSIAKKNDEQAFIEQALLLRASIDRLRGDLARAGDALTEVEGRLQKRLPPEDVAFASLLSERALLAEARGDPTTGLSLIDRSLTIAEASVHAGHWGADLLPMFRVYRSDLEQRLGREDEAVADAERALAEIKEVVEPGAASSQAGQAYLALGRALDAQGKRDEARTAFRSAAENLRDTVGPDHPDTLSAKHLAGAP
jgi:eukaryotic-like serine/threonine-protein kinase